MKSIIPRSAENTIDTRQNKLETRRQAILESAPSVAESFIKTRDDRNANDLAASQHENAAKVFLRDFNLGKMKVRGPSRESIDQRLEAQDGRFKDLTACMDRFHKLLSRNPDLAKAGDNALQQTGAQYRKSAETDSLGLVNQVRNSVDRMARINNSLEGQAIKLEIIQSQDYKELQSAIAELDRFESNEHYLQDEYKSLISKKDPLCLDLIKLEAENVKVQTAIKKTAEALQKLKGEEEEQKYKDTTAVFETFKKLASTQNKDIRKKREEIETRRQQLSNAIDERKEILQQKIKEVEAVILRRIHSIPTERLDHKKLVQGLENASRDEVIARIHKP